MTMKTIDMFNHDFARVGMIHDATVIEVDEEAEEKSKKGKWILVPVLEDPILVADSSGVTLISTKQNLSNAVVYNYVNHLCLPDSTVRTIMLGTATILRDPVEGLAWVVHPDFIYMSLRDDKMLNRQACSLIEEGVRNFISGKVPVPDEPDKNQMKALAAITDNVQCLTAVFCQLEYLHGVGKLKIPFRKIATATPGKNVLQNPIKMLENLNRLKDI